MSAKYKLAATGVIDTDTGDNIVPGDLRWSDYLMWTRANTPDPMDPTPAVPIATRRDLRKTYLGNAHSRGVNKAIPFQGLKFTLTPLDRDILFGLNQSVLDGNPLPAGFGWRADDGTFVAITANQLGNVMQKWSERAFAHKQAVWARLDAIAASDDPDSVDVSININ